jgi:hypothetical protein
MSAAAKLRKQEAADAELRKQEADAALLAAEPGALTIAQINLVINLAIEKLDRSSKERHEQVLSKLDSKCKALEVKIKALEADSKDKDVRITALTDENKLQADLLVSIEKRLTYLQNISNYTILQTNIRGQRDRSWGCRFTNVLFGKSKITAELIYLNIVVPAFQCAIDAGEMTEIPSFRQLFDHQHILYRNKTSGAECWIFRFTTRFLLYKFLQHKKTPLNNVNKDNGFNLSYADATRSQKLALVRASQDCTPFNRQLISTCIRMPDCGMARISGTGVVVAMKSDMVPGAKLTWHKVLDPFGKDLKQMLSTPPTLAELMGGLYGEDNIPPCLRPAPVVPEVLTADAEAAAAANMANEPED